MLILLIRKKKINWQVKNALLNHINAFSLYQCSCKIQLNFVLWKDSWRQIVHRSMKIMVIFWRFSYNRDNQLLESKKRPRLNHRAAKPKICPSLNPQHCISMRSMVACGTYSQSSLNGAGQAFLLAGPCGGQAFYISLPFWGVSYEIIKMLIWLSWSIFLCLELALLCFEREK
jgi:hypothetical protein